MSKQCKYGEIVFMQNEDYQEFEQILEEYGEEQAFNHILQWNYGEGYTDVRDEMPGTNWHEETYHEIGYPDLFMVWSTKYQYVGLFERLDVK